jgi:CopG family transcriptional regulator, nickel-responsive regulator
MSIISLSLPTELLEELDAVLGEEKSATRSEVLRQALRSYLIQYKKLEQLNGEVIATISVLYEKEEKNEELFKLQHEFSDMVTAYLHSHLTETNCLEVMMIKGPAKRFKELIDGLKANKPVKQIKFDIMATFEKETAKH